MQFPVHAGIDFSPVQWVLGNCWKTFFVDYIPFRVLKLLNHICRPLFWHIPPGWGSPHRVRLWLEVRARTIHKICPRGCGASWPMKRWQSRSIEPESTRYRSTNWHPPAGSTAPYLGHIWRDISAVTVYEGDCAQEENKSRQRFVLKYPLKLPFFGLVAFSVDTFITCHAWDEDLYTDYCLHKLPQLSMLLAQNCQKRL